MRSSDLEINELFRKYVANPVLVVIDPNDTAALGLPTKAYVSVEEVSETREGASKSQRAFRHIASTMGALEAEEVGVEHLLRDIRRLSTATLGQSVEARVAALQSLEQQLATLRRYVVDVREGRLPLSQRIVAQLQHAFNLAPAVNDPALARAFAGSVNGKSVVCVCVSRQSQLLFFLVCVDAQMVVYLASLSRSIVALHNLLNNKRQAKDADQADDDNDDGASGKSTDAKADQADGDASKKSADKK